MLDPFIQQAIAQVVQDEWEPHFHPRSYGFRPGRSTHEAVAYAQSEIRECYGWVVDIDLDAFFDRVSHDWLMAQHQDALQTPETHVRCPHCKELVLKEARVCKHCACKLIPQA